MKDENVLDFDFVIIAADARDVHGTSAKPVSDFVDAHAGQIVADALGNEACRRFDDEPPTLTSIGCESPEPDLDPIILLPKNDLLNADQE